MIRSHDHQERHARRAKPTPLGLLALAAAAIAGCAAPAEAGAPLPAVATQRGPSESPAIFGLELAPAQRSDEAQRIAAPGRLVFQDGAVSSAATPVPGRVVTVAAGVGDVVTRGQLLAVVQSPEAASARADLARAQVAVRGAEDVVRRQAVLAANGVGLEVERMAARMRLLDAQAELAGARATVAAIEGRDAAEVDAKAGAAVEIRAPADGRVIARRVEVGSGVEAGAPLFDVGDPTRLWVQLDVYERDLASVTVGAHATVRVGSLGGALRATVARVGGVVDVALRRAPVFLLLEETALPLRPGMFARADIDGDPTGHIVLPATAVVVRDGQQSVVYVAGPDGGFAPRPVQTGNVERGKVAILSGLTEGDAVVVQGALLLDQDSEQLL